MFIDPDWFMNNMNIKIVFLEKDLVFKLKWFINSRNIKPRNGHYIKYFLFYDGTSDGFSPITIENAEAKFSKCIRNDFCQDIRVFRLWQFKILKRLI